MNSSPFGAAAGDQRIGAGGGTHAPFRSPLWCSVVNVCVWNKKVLVQSPRGVGRVEELLKQTFRREC
jgi:hypothetical protein